LPQLNWVLFTFPSDYLLLERILVVGYLFTHCMFKQKASMKWFGYVLPHSMAEDSLLNIMAYWLYHCPLIIFHFLVELAGKVIQYQVSSQIVHWYVVETLVDFLLTLVLDPFVFIDYILGNCCGSWKEKMIHWKFIQKNWIQFLPSIQHKTVGNFLFFQFLMSLQWLK
jgi:hypothetical protein